MQSRVTAFPSRDRRLCPSGKRRSFRKPLAAATVFVFAALVAPVARAQSISVMNFHGGDSRLFTGDGDWAWTYWKGECGQGTNIIVGSSMHYDSGALFDPFSSQSWWTQAILCASSSQIQVDQNNGYTLFSLYGDDRRDTSTGDWSYGNYKAECAATDVMTGMFQSDNSGQSSLGGARCSHSNLRGAKDCAPLVDFGGDDRESPTFGGDWSYGYWKNQCAQGRYVKGVASGGFAAAVILCCTPVF